MRRRVARSWQGFLLVEAVLSAVVIAVGLIFISRGMGSQLRALQALEARDTLLALAQEKFAEVEGHRLSGDARPGQAGGIFEPPADGYTWTFRASPRQDLLDQAGAPTASDVTLTVASQAHPASSVRLATIWPNDWVASEWAQP